jgi:(2S)-methylsuccinyl-CoA dehydrogenase
MVATRSAVDDLLAHARDAADAIEAVYELARTRVRARVVDGATGKLSSEKLDREELAAHGLAVLAAELHAVRELIAWAERSVAVGKGEGATRIAVAYAGELARSLRAGVDLGATESIGLAEMGVGESDLVRTLLNPEVTAVCDGPAAGDALCELAHDAARQGPTFAPALLGDADLETTRLEIRKFVERKVLPIAQSVHQRDVLIPIEMFAELAELGVFGLTIPEEYGGQGLGKVAMCVVTEELARGYLGVGSLGTRSEIAGELILRGGTEAQKKEWLPKIAAGECLPTAVFTEPNHGSDLAHIKTRAERDATGDFHVSGQKTWITHAVRADLMTLLARTKPDDQGYGGLSMLLAPKIRGEDVAGKEFADPGLRGTEIKVLGYRGMKEYELSFEGFRVPKAGLLGGDAGEGQGFKQLMATFESARIQTAARAVGVAQAALDEALKYAQERVQFGKPIFEFPRIARKIGRMMARVQAARQLTLFAARRKDSGQRCDLEAGMAKLIATRAAWECADAAVQVHGGNGYAQEFTVSRLLVDARVLSIFEGANEIQAHVIARRLLEQP